MSSLPNKSNQEIRKYDLRAIEQTIRLIVGDNQVTELRALEACTSNNRRPQTVSGYFDNPHTLARAVPSILSAKGIYFTPNPVNPDLLARRCNQIDYARKGSLTSDGDITNRHWLVIDCDPVRSTGISSTNAEHKAAGGRVVTIHQFLKDRGWPRPIAADSGNGYHLLYRIDLPTNDNGLVQQCLVTLANEFEDDSISIDQRVFNPARIWKLYGTMACKGDNTPSRPHRMSKIIKAPDNIDIVDVRLLEDLAALSKKPTTITKSRQTTASHPQTNFDLQEWIQKHNLDVTGPDPWQDKSGSPGKRWVFNVCPWDSTHTDQAAYIVQFNNGAIAAGCHHNGCAGKDWHALRYVVEPDWQSRSRFKTDATECSDKPTLSIDDWPDPQPLPNKLLPVMPFDFELLPEVFRPWIQDIANRVQCPPDFPAVSAMVALAAIVGRKVGIRPKHHDDWLVVPNLWGGVIGRPGIMKTPAIQEPLKPLIRLEIEAKQKYDQQDKEHVAAQLVADEQCKLTKTKIKNALSKGTDANEIALSLVNEQVQPPRRKRYVINDSTVEKLGELLNEYPNGLLAYRDELIGLLRSLDKEGQEGARAFYLEG